MSTPGHIVTANADYWIRVNLAVELHIKDALLDILHNSSNDPSYQGLPTNGYLLYQRMVQFKTSHGKKLARVLKQDQWDTLCPNSGISNSQEWDITLITVVIINVLQLPPPINGWNQPPHVSDTSKAAFVLRARKIRNEIKHGSLKDISTNQQFNQIWTQTEKALHDVGYNQNKMKQFNDLETNDLEFYTPSVVNILKAKFQQLEVDLHKCMNDQQNQRHQQQQDLIFFHNKTRKDLDIFSRNLQTDIQNVQDTLKRFESYANHQLEVMENQVDENKQRIDKIEALTQRSKDGKYTFALQLHSFSCLWYTQPETKNVKD